MDEVDLDERRLIVRFLDVWEDAAGTGAMPALRDFSSDALEPFKPFSVLIDLQDGYEEPIIRHVGAALSDRMGQDFRGENFQGKSPHDVPRRSMLSRVTDHFYEVLANGAPIGFEAEFLDADGQEVPYRGLLAPLSDDGKTVNFIICVINWLGAPGTETPAPVDDTADEGDGEVSEGRNGPPPTRAELERKLADLRAGAQSLGRSRHELYDLLAAIYGFYQTGHRAGADYKAILKAAGIRAQARAPFTAAIKLVMGADYDKTRVTEYAAAMTHGLSEGLDEAAFRAALEDTPGGLKAMVRAARADRSGAQKDAGENPADTLDRLSPRARIEDKAFTRAGADGFVVLIGRLEDLKAGTVSILDARPATVRDLRRFAERDPQN